jgi:hypothetical protein
MLNLDIYAAATGTVPSGVTRTGTYTAGSTVNVIINSGVVVGSSSIATYSVDTGTGWNVTDVVTITNNGSILGMGGTGNGGAGGPALRAQRAISITNNNIVGGGGGAGGAGQYVYGQTISGKTTITVYAGGGGGGGGAGSNGGAGGGVNGANSGSAGYSGARPAVGNDNPTSGAPGTATAGGQVGQSGIYGWGGIAFTIYNNSYWVAGGTGGAGGSLGANGASGAAGVTTSGINVFGQAGAATAGGAAGAATNGNANITWIVTGTRYGTLG